MALLLYILSFLELCTNSFLSSIRPIASPWPLMGAPCFSFID